MKKSFFRLIVRKTLPTAVLVLSAIGQTPLLAQPGCTQGSTCVSIEGGNSNKEMSKEEARQSKEQWDKTRPLRNKMNIQAEKEFDKLDKAADAKDKCNQSYNVKAYWEPDTGRCLDRDTGRKIINP